MLRSFLRPCVAILAVALISTATSAHATLVLQWAMDNPSPLVDSVGTNNLNLPGSNPTFLPTGGAGGSGAYQFNGVNQYLYPNISYPPTATNIGGLAADWTTSFWVKTTDNGTTTAYVGSPHIPVLGEASGGPIGFSLGVHGGTASFRHYNGLGPLGGFNYVAGTAPLGDGVGHYVTFVHHGGLGTVDIYVDGVADVLGQSANDTGAAPYDFSQLGLSCCGQYGNMTLDDVRIYNSALSSIEIRSLFGPTPVPEPSTLALVGIGIVGLVARRRRGK